MAHLKQGIVDEDVLVLRLNHIVPLGPEAGDMTVYIDCFLVFHPLKHRVYHNEGTSSSNPSAAEKEDRLCISWLIFQ